MPKEKKEKIETEEKKKKANEKQADINESKRWLADRAAFANDMICAANSLTNCKPEERKKLCLAVAMAPSALATIRRGCEAGLEMVEQLEEDAAKATDAAIHDGQMKTSPRPAFEPVQPGL